MQHLDEGTIHAWLDGALGANEARAAEAHVQTCAACAQSVAEARGFVAASSRILAALDDVPTVQESAREPLHISAARRRSGWWWRRAGIPYAAAATVLLAVGTTLVLRNVSPDAAMDRAESPVTQMAAPAEADASHPLVDSAQGNRSRGAGQPTAATGSAREVSGDGARAKRSAVETEPKKDELAIDRVVPLPGPMPRPAAPPSVTPDGQKVAADKAANAAAPSVGALVQGRVLDAATGAPVAGATVSIDAARVARTDSAGKFQLQAAPLGQQTVSVRALGFQSVQHPVAIAPSDSVELGFALQKSTTQLQNVVVTGAAAQAQQRQAQGSQVSAARERRLADSVTASQAASPTLRLEDVRRNAANVVGCYTLRAVPGRAARDADHAVIASMPSRVQLEAQARERAYSSEMLVNRARTLTGIGRAESWRFVGDSLEIAWTDDAGRQVLRFARREATWTSDLAVMEACPAK
jgi:hypothetical protein